MSQGKWQWLDLGTSDADAGIVDQETRSRMMRGIPGRDTRPDDDPEGLHARRFRYRVHVARLPGKPDIVLPKFRSVVLNGRRRDTWHVSRILLRVRKRASRDGGAESLSRKNRVNLFASVVVLVDRR